MKRRIYIFIKLVVLLLLLFFVVGLSIQLFAPDGSKVTDWLENGTLQVGDEVTVLYVKQEIYENDEELSRALAGLDWSEATIFGGGVGQQLVLATFTSDDVLNAGEIHLFAIRTRSYGGDNTSGWASYSLSVSYDIKLLDYGDGQSESELNAYPLTVTAVYQQEIWQDVISKKPF